MHIPYRAITTPKWDVGGLGDLLGNNRLGMFGSSSLFPVFFSDTLLHSLVRFYAIAFCSGECPWQKQPHIHTHGLVRSRPCAFDKAMYEGGGEGPLGHPMSRRKPSTT